MVYSERKSVRDEFKEFQWKLYNLGSATERLSKELWLSTIKEQAKRDSQELTESFWVSKHEELFNKDKELNDGLKAIADRIKPGPGPLIPDAVWKLCFKLCFIDEERQGETEFPSLDIATRNPYLNFQTRHFIAKR